MEHFEKFDSLTPDQKPAPEIPKEEILDQAVLEARERIRTELKEAQKESEDKLFSKINVDGLNGTALMVLNELAKGKNFFPKRMMMKVEIEAAQESPLYADKRAYDNPGERKEYLDEFLSLYANEIKEIIVSDPNKYYTEDILRDYAREEKTTEQGIAQPNTGA